MGSGESAEEAVTELQGFSPRGHEGLVNQETAACRAEPHSREPQLAQRAKGGQAESGAVWRHDEGC